ncbi:MAG: sulfite exporter TauE/SafE family protein [Planctomycetia bacterium]|nr:sulfite exporter TauE/SafE family protein [Planctomycetia bacterium]
MDGVPADSLFLQENAPGLAALAAVTSLAAAINSMAGGGTILTFPVLAAILPAGPTRMVVANATSTIGLWPGAVSAAWAYRGERSGQPPWSRWLLVPSVAGALVGSALVLVLPARWFDSLVPWLILAAAILFAVQPKLARLTMGREPTAGPAEVPPRTIVVACLLQFLVAVYGGYFGAGIGILMLAMLGSLGLGDIHRLNAVKNVLGTLVNGTAAGLFAIGPLCGWSDVSWPHAGVMAAAALLGGYAGGHLARRMPAAAVRRAVAVIGFALAGYYFLA